MNEFYEELDKLYGAGDLAAVEKLILDALAAAGESSMERAGLYNELAGFYRGVSRFDESGDAFERALDIFSSRGMGASPEYATVLLNLAGLYRMKGEADKAVGLFLNAMKKLEDAGEEDSYAYVSVLNNLALAYQEKREPGLAFDYASKALSRMRGGEGNEHEIAVSLNNLAAIEISRGAASDADAYITEALALYDAMPEPNVHHAAALTTKGVLMCRGGDYRNALDCFRRALDLTRHFFGENIEYAACKRNIADVCAALGDTGAAISEQKEALRILERIHGADHPSAREARAGLERLEQGLGNNE